MVVVTPPVLMDQAQIYMTHPYASNYSSPMDALG